MSTNTTNIQKFFAGRSFEIPSYQRDYAWNTVNIDDLFDDIIESMEIGEGHYLGTFILSVTDNKDHFKVVDGQQRLTTLTILLDALVDALPDVENKIIYRAKYLHHSVKGKKCEKLSMIGSNKTFFTALLDDTNPEPDSGGQKRMKVAYDWIQQRVQSIKELKGVDIIQDLLSNIDSLEVLEFVEQNEGKAIRMFQSVNDRGISLSKMDIAKSLLIYYSNRFLNGELDNFISDQFGITFRNYSLIKGLAAENGYKIQVIDKIIFREDDIFRYHYFSYNTSRLDIKIPFDYDAKSETVLEILKQVLKQLRNDEIKLREFIHDYVTDITAFSSSFRDLIKDTRKDKELYMIFVVGNLSATLYPLIIRLAMRNELRCQIESAGNRTLLEMIEVTDLRVYKLRDNPRADMFNFTHEIVDKCPNEIADFLRKFVKKFMNDNLFESSMSQEDLYRNHGLVRTLCAFEEKQRIDLGKPEFSLTDLVSLVNDGQTIEHILPQKPLFDIKSYDFSSKEEYVNYINRIGNLTLLETVLNSSCSNKSIENKIKDESLYKSSKYKITSSLAAGIKTSVFSRKDIDARGDKIAKFCVEHWPLW